MRKLYLATFTLAFLTFTSCGSDSESGGGITPEPPSEVVVKPNFTPIQVTRHEGKPFSTGVTSRDGKNIVGPGGPVMMQAFYWDVPHGGTWWNVLSEKIPSWAGSGITSMWLPPVTKGQSGGYSMGYDPYDYFDFGQYDQQGTTETRFGNETELVHLISTAHSKSMLVFADMVLNHNSGGASEYDPNIQDYYWTDFTGVKSGKFPRTYLDFYTNEGTDRDEGYFGEGRGMPDLRHTREHVQNWLWKSPESVAKYYKNTLKFDGWRFDYVKGFGTWVIREWNKSVGGFSVGENWDGNPSVLENWANSAESAVFDFSLYYKMDQAFDEQNLMKLTEDVYWKRNPYKAVTFVTNHDTDDIWNKHYAYAYILTHEGYPTIFYRDYEEWLDKNKLNTLIKIHNERATGNTTILYADKDEYIARRNGYNGNPGLVVYLNTSEQTQEKWVETNWASAAIKDHTSHAAAWNPTTRADKWVKIKCPPKSYTVWSTP